LDRFRLRVPAAVRAIALQLLHRAALRRLRALATPTHPGLERILAAVELALQGRADPDERAWIARIERRRRELLASDEPLAPVDYGAGQTSAADRHPQVAGEAEWTVGGRCRSSKSPFWALLLFRLVRELRPERCLELGTNCGISAAYQAAALRLNGAGSLRTVEGNPALVALSRRSLASLGLAATVEEGRFADVLPRLLEEEGPFDHVFVDGHHDGAGTVGYFEQLLPRLGPAAVVVFDDIAWSTGMAQAWQTLRAHPRVRVAVDLGAMGVCVVDGGAGPAIRVTLPLRG